MSKEKIDNDRWIIWVALGVTTLIIGLWFLTIYFLEGDKERGTFGDMFGSINALFSGLAMAGIILTILLQRKELKLQREELRDTRGEFEKQNETLRLQRFENTFFSMISIHLEMVQSLSSREYNSQGREIFNALLRSWSIKLSQEAILNYKEEDFLKYQGSYRKNVKIEVISHYLQSLTSIYNVVSTSDLLNEPQKNSYHMLIKSYISFPERKFLYYFLILGITRDSTIETLRYLERNFMFIGTLSKDDLIDPSHIKLLDQFQITSS